MIQHLNIKDELNETIQSTVCCEVWLQIILRMLFRFIPFHLGRSYLAEPFRQITRNLAELFRQITCNLAEP